MAPGLSLVRQRPYRCDNRIDSEDGFEQSGNKLVAPCLIGISDHLAEPGFRVCPVMKPRALLPWSLLACVVLVIAVTIPGA